MSTSSTRIPELMAANATFAESYTTPPPMTYIRDVVREALLVLTCMDPRVVPESFVGPHPMVAVFRNAGGRVTPDVVRTISVLRSLMHKHEKATVMVVHHTDCGMTHVTNDEIRSDVVKRDPKSEQEVADVDFGCFSSEDLEKFILQDVEALKAENVLKGVEVRGFVLTTETGVLREL